MAHFCITGWWFQRLWKILVSWGDYSQHMEKWKMFQTTNQITSPIKTWRCSMDFPCRQLLHDTRRTSHQLDPPLSFWRIGHPSPASMVCNGLTWIIWGYPRDLNPKRMHIDGMDGIDGEFCARRDIARLKCSKGMHSFPPVLPSSSWL